MSYGRYYRRWHDESDAHFAKEVERWTCSLAPWAPADRKIPILEIGSGMGFALAALKQMGFEDVRGIDADAGQVAAARKRNAPCEHVPVADTLAYLAGRRGKFGFCLLVDVLEHVPVDNQLAFLDAICQSLAPGGRLYCRVPNASAAVASRYRYHDWTHRASFTEASLDFVLHTAGFDEIEVFEVDVLPRPRLPLILRTSVLRWIAYRALRGFWRLQYAVEFGTKEAVSIPLTPNIGALAGRTVTK